MITGATKQNIWITADTHYNHKNICHGVTDWRNPDGTIPIAQTRDFPTIQKMNDAMVNGINGVVMQDDILIHLGDWSFGGFDSIRELYDRLVCKNIYLFLGNHDRHILKNKNNIRELFLSVDKENDEYRYEKYQFHLHHYPIMSWRDMKQGTIHLHGHTHFTGDNRFGQGKKMDVGIDGHPEFRPYSLKDEIIPFMTKRPVMSEYETVIDHHIDRMKHKHS
jgi:calcineurin-like phosphoesterase family protein